MDLVGIEPTTSSMPWKRAPSCATGPLAKDGAACSALNIFSQQGAVVKRRALTLRGPRLSLMMKRCTLWSGSTRVLKRHVFSVSSHDHTVSTG